MSKTALDREFAATLADCSRKMSERAAKAAVEGNTDAARLYRQSSIAYALKASNAYADVRR